MNRLQYQTLFWVLALSFSLLRSRALSLSLLPSHPISICAPLLLSHTPKQTCNIKTTRTQLYINMNTKQINMSSPIPETRSCIPKFMVCRRHFTHGFSCACILLCKPTFFPQISCCWHQNDMGCVCKLHGDWFNIWYPSTGIPMEHQFPIWMDHNKYLFNEFDHILFSTWFIHFNKVFGCGYLSLNDRHLFHYSE